MAAVAIAIGGLCTDTSCARKRERFLSVIETVPPNNLAPPYYRTRAETDFHFETFESKGKLWVSKAKSYKKIVELPLKLKNFSPAYPPNILTPDHNKKKLFWRGNGM